MSNHIEAGTNGSERGAGLAEYGLLLLLVALVSIGILTTLGLQISGFIDTASAMF